MHSFHSKGTDTSKSKTCPQKKTHVLAYPFPSSGHVIPLLDLTKALVSRGIYVTVLITPANLPLIPTHYSPLLQTLLLPAPQFPDANQNRLIATVTNMRHHHYPFLLHWAQTQTHTSPPSAIISDFFLGWTHHLARDLHVPRLVFSPSGAFALSISFSLWRDLPQPNDEPNPVVSFPNIPNSPIYPWWQITQHYRDSKRGDPEWEFHRENTLLNLATYGVVFNTFTELERVYLSHVKRELGHDRVWAVGPVLPPEDGSTGSADRGGSSTVPCHELMAWLDSRADGSVVYVCFGSRTFLTSDQMEVLTRALELSGVHFVLSVMGSDGAVPDGFEDRVREKGFVIRGWAPQLAVLRHRAVGAFLTHCGWNSVLEGLASDGVVMLTWPMGADQFTNAKLVVDQLGVAVRAAEGTEKVPEARELGRRIERALVGRTKERVRGEELREVALDAIRKEGSSQKELDALVKHLNELQNVQVEC